MVASAMGSGLVIRTVQMSGRLTLMPSFNLDKGVFWTKHVFLTEEVHLSTILNYRMSLPKVEVALLIAVFTGRTNSKTVSIQEKEVPFIFYINLHETVLWLWILTYHPYEVKADNLKKCFKAIFWCKMSHIH